MSFDEIKTGTIKRIFRDKGFGFIKAEDSSDIFFHMNDVVDPGFDKLKAGMSVNYLIGQGRKGPEAKSIVAIPDKQ